MAKKSPLETFCEVFEIKLKKAGSAAQLAKAEKRLGSQLPKSLREFYQCCDGGVAGNDLSMLRLHSVKAALEYGRMTRFFDSNWGLWPLLENNDSNPLCVCCRSPIAGYVVLVSHDDAPRLLFRSLDGFFRAAIDYVADGTFLDTHQLPSEFDGPNCTKRDLSAARRLIQLTQQDDLDEEDRTDAARFACDLLGDDNVAEIQGLLEIENEYVHAHVMARLKRIPGAKARTAQRKSADNFDSFVEECGRLLQREGIAATVLAKYGKKTICIEPGPIWLNMEMFYAARKRPASNAYLLERARSLVAMETKAGRKRK